MKNRLFLSNLIAILSITTVFGGNNHIAHFDTDKDLLTIDEQRRMRQWMSTLPDSVEHEFFLFGHTDLRGSGAYNQHLSERRVSQVAQFMKKEGVPMVLINTEAMGERFPAAIQKSARAHRENRRVVILAKALQFSHVTDIDSMLMRGTEKKYQIDPSKSHVLVGRFGTKVHVPADVFAVIDGSPITITVREAVQPEQMLALGLSTNTANSLLETGGMMYLEARDEDGNKLSLSPDKELEVAFPKRTSKPGMQYYRAPSAQSPWELAESDPFQILEMYNPREESRKQGVSGYWHMKEQWVDLPRPVKPIPPMKPSRPGSLDQSKYINEIKWYEFNKKKKQVEMKASMQYAMKQYDAREERYNLFLERYESALKEYHRKVDDYYAAIRNWKLKEGKELRTKKVFVSESSNARFYQIGSIEYLDQQASRKYNADLLVARSAMLDETKTAELADVQGYVMKVTSLGWINCDRIPSEIKGPERTIMAYTGDNQSKRVMLVFDEYDMAMNFGMDLETPSVYRVNNIPKNAEVTVLAYGVIDGAPHIFVQKATSMKEVKVELKPSSFAELSEILATL